MPSKMPTGEPGGPDSEMFYDFDPSGKTHDPKFGKYLPSELRLRHDSWKSAIRFSWNIKKSKTVRLKN